MRRIDPPGCRCTNCDTGDSRPARDLHEYRLGEAIIPLAVRFTVGHGRPDLDFLFRIAEKADMALSTQYPITYDLVEIHNMVTNYLNTRTQPTEIP